MIKMNDLILWILALIPLTVNAAAYSRLPKEINIVFGGETMPKSYILFPPLLILLLMLCFYGAILYLRKKQQSTENEKTDKLRSREKASFMIAYFMIIALNIINLGNLFQALGNHFIDNLKITCIVMGVLITVIGNFQPKLHKYKDPVKTKWNNADSTVWLKANRFTGFVMVLCGILIITETLIFDTVTALILMPVLMIAASIIAAIYSNQIYKQHLSNKK